MVPRTDWSQAISHKVPQHDIPLVRKMDVHSQSSCGRYQGNRVPDQFLSIHGQILLFWHGQRHDVIPGNPYCPLWMGRAKVMVRPKHNKRINVHGNIPEPDPSQGQIHFHPNVAHFKEWPHLFSKHKVTNRSKQDFVPISDEEVNLHNFTAAHAPNSNGTHTMHYDGSLEKWFRFVISRASVVN